MEAILKGIASAAVAAFVLAANAQGPELIVDSAPATPQTQSWEQQYVVPNLAVEFATPTPTPEPVLVAHDVPAWASCSCVEGAKRYAGLSGSWGHAGDIKPNTDRPVVGGFGLTTEHREGDRPGHLFMNAEVFELEGRTFVRTIEWNFGRCGVSSRVLAADDERISGWLKPTGPDPAAGVP